MNKVQVRQLRNLVTLTGLLIVFLAGTVLAADLPSAQQVFDDYIEATGGKDAYLAHESMTITASFEMPAMGIVAPMMIYQALPGLAYTKIESAAIGIMESGSNDGVHWEKSMMGGAKVKEGEEKAMVERANDMQLWLHWQDYYSGAEVTGIEELEGQECYVVVLTPKVGKPETSWVGVESKLIVRTNMTLTNEMGDVSVESYPSDYRESDGVLIPFTTRQVIMGVQEILIKMEAVEWNKEIPEGTFDIPAEVQALVDAE